MTNSSFEATVDALLRVNGRTFAEDVGINLRGDDEEAVFCLLVSAVLFSSRIGHRLAASAARALFAEGWTNAQALADAGWDARTRVLNDAGYARYDESTSRMLGDTCQIALERYEGDLRRLRQDADGDVATLTAALMEFKGLGEVGAGIFVREVQSVWPEFAPYADERVLAAAEDLGLPKDPQALSRLSDGDPARLMAALIRTSIEDDVERVLAVAAGDQPAPIDPDRMTRQDLYDEAARLDVSGRSSMRKSELADAVEHAQKERSIDG